MRAAISLLLIAPVLSGCVTAERARFDVGASQTAMVRDGRTAVVSKKGGSVVIASPASREFNGTQRPVFVLAIHNQSRAPLDFRLDTVAVMQTQDGQPVRTLPVIPYEQLVSEERTRQVAAVLITGLAAGVNAAAASRSGYSPLGNAIARVRADAQNDAMISDTLEAGRLNLARLEGTIIKDNTVLPGEWYGGQLHISAPEANSSESAKTYTINVRVGAETHEIKVVQARAG